MVLLLISLIQPVQTKKVSASRSALLRPPDVTIGCLILVYVYEILESPLNLVSETDELCILEMKSGTQKNVYDVRPSECQTLNEKSQSLPHPSPRLMKKKKKKNLKVTSLLK